MEEKIYYSIKEVAQITGVSQPTLRYWEKEFAQIKPTKNSRGVRYYKKEDIELLQKIVYLTKQLKMTIQGAKKALSNNRIQGDDYEVLQTLLQTKDFLTKLKQKIDEK